MANIHIDDVDDEDVIRALRILHCAKRPLLRWELMEVLAVDCDAMIFDQAKRTRLGEGRELFVLCRDLAKLQRKQAKEAPPGFAGDQTRQSYTMEDLQLPEVQTKEGHKILCLASLAYLHHLHKHDTSQARRQPFAVYSAKHWVDHAKEASEDHQVTEAIICFLEKTDAVDAWLRIHDDELLQLDEILTGTTIRRYDWMPAGRSSLFHAIFHGLNRVRDELLSQLNLELCDLEESTYAACLRGDLESVDMLAARGVDANPSYGPFESILTAAAFGGNGQLFQLLLERGSRFPPGVDDTHPLIVAVKCGHGQVVDILLSKDWQNKKVLLDQSLQLLVRKGLVGRNRHIVAALRSHGADLSDHSDERS